MSYTGYLSNSLKVLLFNAEAAEENAKDSEATKYGFITLAIVGLVSAIINMVLPVPGTAGGLGYADLLLKPIMVIISFIIGYSIYHFLAKILGGKATGAEYFRVLSGAMVVSLLTTLLIALTGVGFPLALGSVSWLLVGGWIMAVNTLVLHKVHQLSVLKAVMLGIVLPLAMLALLAFIMIGTLFNYGAGFVEA